MFRSPKKLKSLIEVPYVVHVTARVLGSYTEKDKIVDGRSVCSTPESTGSKHQYQPHLFSAAHSQTELSVSGKIRKIRKTVAHRKAKMVDRSSLCSAPESTGFKLQYEQSLFSVGCSQTKLFISLKNLGYQEKGPLTIKQKSLIEVPYVVYLKVQVLSFNKNLISSSQRVPRASYPFRLKFGGSGKGSFTEKSKVVDRGSICSAPESTVSKLQYEPFVFCVA